MSFYKQKKDSPFIDIPDSVEVKKSYKAKLKKAVALPWWKRILLYLANH
jgi:hypothetical protein